MRPVRIQPTEELFRLGIHREIRISRGFELLDQSGDVVELGIAIR